MMRAAVASRYYLKLRSGESVQLKKGGGVVGWWGDRRWVQSGRFVVALSISLTSPFAPSTSWTANFRQEV